MSKSCRSLAVLAVALLAIASALMPVSCQFFEAADAQHRSMIYLSNRVTHDCEHSFIMQDFVTIEGNVKVTTAPAPPAARRQTICKTPLVPFGKLTQDRRGIHFWYLRLKVTQLHAGQTLHIFNTDSSTVPNEVEKDQRFDLTATSHSYPLIMYMKYRYVSFHWKEEQPSGPENYLNITVSTYAKFNESVNATMQKELCDRYGNTWCDRRQATICMGPNSCSLQDDCFDQFHEPSRCSDFLWINGNLTIAGSSLRATGWILRNMPWFALGAVPLVLIVALAKICSQKRDLDIDDDYEYKLSCSDHHDADTCRNGNAVHRRSSHGEEANEEEDNIDDNEDESSTSSGCENSSRARARESDGGDGDGAAAYYSYPTTVVITPNLEASKSTDSEDKEAGSDSEESSPPPPPPRLSQSQHSQPQQLSESAGSNNRVLHRLTEVSLEDDDEEGDDGNGAKRRAAEGAEDDEEEEFVNVEYLRQHPIMPPILEAARVTSGEYTKAEPSESPQRDSYTRLLSQPSPDTIKELLKPSPGSSSAGLTSAAVDNASSGNSTATAANGVVYAQLVLPPPNRSQPAGHSAAASSASTPSESLELQPVKTPKPTRGTYDANYIVV